MSYPRIPYYLNYISNISQDTLQTLIVQRFLFFLLTVFPFTTLIIGIQVVYSFTLNQISLLYNQNLKIFIYLYLWQIVESKTGCNGCYLHVLTTVC